MVYKLKIEKVSGDGEAAFDAAGTRKEIDYTGTGSITELPLYGIKESTEENNIKITGSKDGKTLDEQTFIVFSEIKIKWDSKETQHKDTDAVCTKCDGQTGVPPAHRHDENTDGIFEPSSHISFHCGCPHCGAYCARCCMKVIKEKGSKQDDFRNYDDNGQRMTVEQNHAQWFYSEFAPKYGFEPLSKKSGVAYNSVYTKLVEGDKPVVHFAAHCHVVPSIRHNMACGTIKPKQSYYWDPQNAVFNWGVFGGDLYLYLK